MATDTGYQVIVGSSISADNRAGILKSVLEVVPPKTRTVTFATTYAAGTTSVNQATLTIGTTATLGIRLIMDSAVVGTAYVASLLRALLQALAPYGVVLTNAASYTAGDRTYNVTITIT
uniref:Uncharacterized protein n=1 Tax=viral metagenome TaxID=1070528 RepID=A0A6M3K352_9ZZZZ